MWTSRCAVPRCTLILLLAALAAAPAARVGAQQAAGAVLARPTWRARAPCLGFRRAGQGQRAPGAEVAGRGQCAAAECSARVETCVRASCDPGLRAAPVPLAGVCCVRPTLPMVKSLVPTWPTPPPQPLSHRRRRHPRRLPRCARAVQRPAAQPAADAAPGHGSAAATAARPAAAAAARHRRAHPCAHRAARRRPGPRPAAS